jgi:2OG-Fe(II) oxygenase superfamily
MFTKSLERIIAFVPPWIIIVISNARTHKIRKMTMIPQKSLRHYFCHHPSWVLLVTRRFTAAARVITTNVQPRPRPLRRQRCYYCYFSTTSSNSSNHNATADESSSAAAAEPIFNADRFLSRLRRAVPAMAASLRDEGYWTNLPSDDQDDDASITKITEESGNDEELLSSSSSSLFLMTLNEIQTIRRQAIQLRQIGRFEPSWSERMDAMTGETERFNKHGVYACEPDGSDYDTAPDLLSYMSTVIHHLPPLLNEALRAGRRRETNNNNTATTTTTPPLLLDNYYPAHISNRAFNAKLAVTLPGGSVYPLHVDNPESGRLLPNNNHKEDTRKLTCILYLNPVYAGGDLRLYLLQQRCVDLSPRAGRLVLFWSDEIPHEVLPCAPDHHHNNNDHDDFIVAKDDDDDDNDDDPSSSSISSSSAFDRYALTIWWPDDNPHHNVHRHGSKFEPLRVGAFTKEKWC